jgi:hypothetical protein
MMRTPKIEALHRLIIWLNKDLDLNIPVLPLDKSSLISNGWLAGFVDADGYFYIKHSESMINGRKKESISCRFQLEQRKSYSRDGKSYENIMLKIAVLFDVPLKTIKRVDSEIYCVSVNSIRCLAKVQDYFERYPLMSSTKKYFFCRLSMLAFSLQYNIR